MPALRRVAGLTALVLLAAAFYGCDAAPKRVADAARTPPAPPALASVAALPVLPGAQGFGLATPAGRRGTVYRVTTLADAGPGSLRAALEQAGSRVVIFDVGGTIALTRNIVVSQPFVTIAGQTAPSPGITLSGAGLVIETHDVLLEHLRVRVGDAQAGPPADERDGLRVGAGGYNVVASHLSLAWAVDEGGSASGTGIHDVTFIDCIFSENLSRSIHPKGEHSRGFLVHAGVRRLAVVGSLFAHNYTRSPGINGGTSVFVGNNLVYDPGLWGAGFWDVRDAPVGPTDAVLAGNAFVLGPSSGSLRAPVAIYSTVSAGSRIFVHDNVVNPSGRPVLWVQRGTPAVLAPAPPPGLAMPRMAPASEVEGRVLARAGARPRDRDAVDRRVVAQVAQRTGRIIDSPAAVGGLPPAAPALRRLVLPPRHNADDDRDGYTNLEEWLHAKSDSLSRP